MFEIVHTEKIGVQPPLHRRSLRPVSREHHVPVIVARADIDCPLILTSDLHSNGLTLVEQLQERLDRPGDWTMISAGDMAGAGVMGSDGDALPVLEAAREAFGRLFFVMGNHDLETNLPDGWRNPDGSRCRLHGQVQTVDGLGRIAGVDGIISRKHKPHRLAADSYLTLVESLAIVGLDWLVTHETPDIPEVTGIRRGNHDVRETVLAAGVGRHVFGHCGFEHWQGRLDQTLFLNVDHRIVLARPRSASRRDLG